MNPFVTATFFNYKNFEIKFNYKNRPFQTNVSGVSNSREIQ